MNTKDVIDFYPLSPMQQGMLYHSLLSPESGMYIEQQITTLRGALDAAAFERCWQRLLERHAILRTGFIVGKLKEPVQVVYRQVTLPVLQEDWRGLSTSERTDRFEALLRADRQRGFDLAKAPLMRLTLLRTGDDLYDFVWTYHHMLLDGWSMPLLLQELLAFYQAFRSGRALHLPPPRPYRDYIAWLRRQDMAQAEQYWRRTLAGFRAPTPLAVERPCSTVAPGEVTEEELQLPVEVTGRLRALCKQAGLTMNTLLQGAWALLLSRYSGEEDVVFGATVSGRPPQLQGAETMVGLFINTLPVRVRTPADARVIPWLQSLQAQQAQQREYEYSPLVQVQAWSEVPRGTELFGSILVFENYPIPRGTGEGPGRLTVESFRSAERANYGLVLVGGLAETLMLKIAFDRQRFDPITIKRMLGHLVNLLEAMAAGPGQTLGELPILSQAERRRLLVEWNDTAAPYPALCVHQQVALCARQEPEAVAIRCGEAVLTYGELDRRSCRLAHFLRRQGVGRGSLVAICAEPSLEMIVGLLGVLRAGAAYLPLDPAYPPERLAYMLDDSGAMIVLAQEVCRGVLPAGRPVVSLDGDWAQIAQEMAEDPPDGATGDDAAYCIYTSGSTGRPKGVLAQHRGLANVVQAWGRIAGVRRGCRMAFLASFSFDPSLLEIFAPLTVGGTVCVVSREVRGSIPELHRLLQEQEVTILNLTPSVLQLLPPEGLPALETVIAGGEALSWEIVERWARPPRRLINAYGPTETTIQASWYECTRVEEGTRTAPIGRPIANVQLYVLDAHQQPVPVGVPGELYIGGLGVTRGYLNRPELTAERFIPNPFARGGRSETSPSEGGERLYRTGDLVRYRDDGALEFLGRIDQQVKLRGFRIELGEIEAVLCAHPKVEQAAVLAREDTPGDKRLVAYIVSAGQEAPGVDELRAHLEQRLPAYMLPAAFVFLDALPMTTNGKVDRRALPEPDRVRPELERAYVPPRDALEAQLVGIWEEVLDVRPVGVTDDFFALGGHSLLAVRLLSHVQQRLGREVPLLHLFEEPTIEHMASVLRNRGGAGAEAVLVPIQPEGKRRPLFFVHPSGGSVHWYADLARRLGKDQPFYGLQARGLNGEGELHTQVEEMAACYVEAIRAFQPEGPYLIGSWSMGVVVAYEMARQLHAQGQETAFLALVDQGPVLPAAEPEDDAAYLVETFGKQVPLSLETLRELGDFDAQVAYVLDEAKRVEFVYPDTTLAQFSHFVRLLRTHTEAWRRYPLRPYPGRVTLFRATEQPEGSSPERDLGWGALAAAVDVYDVEGDHLSIMHEPGVEGLARALSACLEQAPSLHT